MDEISINSYFIDTNINSSNEPWNWPILKMKQITGCQYFHSFEKWFSKVRRKKKICLYLEGINLFYTLDLVYPFNILYASDKWWLSSNFLMGLLWPIKSVTIFVLTFYISILSSRSICPTFPCFWLSCHQW